MPQDSENFLSYNTKWFNIDIWEKHNKYLTTILRYLKVLIKKIVAIDMEKKKNLAKYLK